MLEVKALDCNWFYCNEGQEHSTYKVGESNVEKISYHEPAGPGDCHYCDVKFTDGEEIRIFNINKIIK